ncbi:hypothetical protein EG328_005608 [Venturia inaequalis]|uniref:Uncharacterized protein n=1 Tax=Venturia inaequalis TaxID=5025 RepID=A0A8H3ZA94_VENIN|nr:hypothetical protein EG328_005608 [Venturia inaequalis]
MESFVTPNDSRWADRIAPSIEDVAHVRHAAGLFGLVSHLALPGDKVAVLSTFDVLRPLGDHDELMGALKQSVASNRMRMSLEYLLTIYGLGLWSLSLPNLLKLFSSIIRKIQF